MHWSKGQPYGSVYKVLYGTAASEPRDPITMAYISDMCPPMSFQVLPCHPSGWMRTYLLAGLSSVFSTAYRES